MKYNSIIISIICQSIPEIRRSWQRDPDPYIKRLLGVWTHKSSSNCSDSSTLIQNRQHADQVPVPLPGCDDHLHPGHQGSRCRLSLWKIRRTLRRLGQRDLSSGVQGGRTIQWPLQSQSEMLVRGC